MEQPDRLDPDDIRIFSGSSNPALATAVADYLQVPLNPTRVRRFSNDNLYIQLGASVRSRVVYVVQSFNPPVNDHIVELLMMLDIARGAAARLIGLPLTAVARERLGRTIVANVVGLPPINSRPRARVSSASM